MDNDLSTKFRETLAGITARPYTASIKQQTIAIV